MKQFYILFGMLLCVALQVNAQQKVEIVGKVLDAKTNEPLSFATVALRENKTNTPITGLTTGMDGTFTLATESSDFYIEISFLGYVAKRIDDFSLNNGKIDLGVLSLEESSQVLDEVVVSGTKSSTEFQIDKRVFNIGNDISSTGMGALEVLNRVPSVTVNIEGEVSLRGSGGVQILIDGKPSILADDQSNALGSLTADMIEKIEVITNPSAKYDAEGSSGILNIVLKKEEKKGINGSVSLNTGMPDNHSFGLSMNKRSEKFNLFTQLGAGYRSLPRETENINQDLVNNTLIESDGIEYRNEMFYNMILGADYYINKNNVITLSGNFTYEVEDQPSETNFRSFDANGELVSEWERNEDTEATNPKWQYEVQYKKDFENDKGHDLIFSALGRSFGKDQSSEFSNNFIIGDNNLPDQETRTTFEQVDYTFKLDYTNPISDRFSVETGAQYVINQVGNDFSVADIIEDEVIVDESLTNNFEFDQRVLGLYGTGAYKFNKWGLKLGLRVENTSLNTLLVNTEETNDRNYTNLFPSAHTSYKFSEAFSLQAGYSRRIYRPRLWDLNPFFNIRNNFNIRTGNPDLNPEFTDSYEVTGIYIIGNLALNLGTYWRNTTDVIERVAIFEDNVTITTPENIGSNQTTGFEINAEYDITNWWSTNGDFNYNRFIRLGSLDEQVFDFQGEQYTARVTSRFKLPKDFEIELTGNHRSGFLTVQGERLPTSFLDIGIRKGFMKKKAVVSFGIRDVFATRVQEGITTQDTFYASNFRQRGRFLTLGFSYGFGKGEAMTYSGNRRR